MPEQPSFPRIYYSAAEPTGRIFETEEELKAAGPGWQPTPLTADAPPTPPPTPEPPHSEDEPPPIRSRR